MKRFVIIIVALTIIIGLGSYFYQQTIPAESNRPSDQTNLETVPVERQTMVDTVNATGKIKPSAEVGMNFELGGVVAEVLVKQGQYVTRGTILARLETDDLALQIARAEIEVARSEADMQLLLAPDPAEQEDIMATRAQIEAARLKLQELQNNPDLQDEVTQAAAALSESQIALDKAQSDYDRVAYRGDVGARSEADGLQQATLNYETALANYNIAIRGLTPKDSELADARASLLSQEAALAKLLHPVSKAEIAKQEAAIQLAKIDLAEKRRELEQAVMVAPTDGVVLDVTIEPGERVLQDAQDAAILLADTGTYLLKVEIDEIDIGRIKPYQPTTIGLDAFAESNFNGMVTDIAPRPNDEGSSNLVTYEVTIAMETNAETPSIRSGMTANAAIETQRLKEVLVVPNQAIQFEQSSEIPRPFVETIDEAGNLQRVEVKLGLRNAEVTEIIVGLAADDEVVIRPLFMGRGSEL